MTLHHPLHRWPATRSGTDPRSDAPGGRGYTHRRSNRRSVCSFHRSRFQHPRTSRRRTVVDQAHCPGSCGRARGPRPVVCPAAVPAKGRAGDPARVPPPTSASDASIAPPRQDEASAAAAVAGHVRTRAASSDVLGDVAWYVRSAIASDVTGEFCSPRALPGPTLITSQAGQHQTPLRDTPACTDRTPQLSTKGRVSHGGETRP